MGIQQCQNYRCRRGNVNIKMDDGTVQYLPVILVEVRFTRPSSDEPWGLWIQE